MQLKLAEKQFLEERAAAIAHEVKNPLTMVGFNLDILEASDERPHADRNYAMIRKELKKISDLMLDFLYLNSSNQGEETALCLSNLLNEMAEDLRVSLPDISLHITYPQSPIVITASENSLRTLFGNIIKNAIEAMDYKGEVQICIEKKEDYTQVSFKDSGPGLCPDVQKKLFNEHFTTKPMGSGLGLSICQKITTELGGDFSLMNCDGGGCLAVVRLKM